MAWVEFYYLIQAIPPCSRSAYAYKYNWLVRMAAFSEPKPCERLYMLYNKL